MFHKEQFLLETPYLRRMERKRWTAKTATTEADLLFREKRKWQIALRRYVIEKNLSSFYAPYFGLDIEHIRKWISLQFDSDMNWENFSKVWQFDHIVPLGYFDFRKERDLRLCWNFVNIRPEKLNKGAKTAKTGEVLAAKVYFQAIFDASGSGICKEMIAKIEEIEQDVRKGATSLAEFLVGNKLRLQSLADFGSAEYASLNKGTELQQIVEEQAFLKKYG